MEAVPNSESDPERSSLISLPKPRSKSGKTWRSVLGVALDRGVFEVVGLEEAGTVLVVFVGRQCGGTIDGVDALRTVVVDVVGRFSVGGSGLTDLFRGGADCREGSGARRFRGVTSAVSGRLASGAGIPFGTEDRRSTNVEDAVLVMSAVYK